MDELERSLDKAISLVAKSSKVIYRNGERYNLVGYTPDRLRIDIRGREHYPTHFHVILVSKKVKAKFDLDTGEFIKGTAPARVIKAVRKWHEENKYALIEKWNECNPDKKIIQ